MDKMDNIYRYLPSVEKPKARLSFRDKFKWTVGVLIIYFVMTQIMVFGISPEAEVQFRTFEILLGSSIGSLVTLGIGPIVSASIVLQLLVGSKILKWDLSSHEGRAKFQGTQKLLAFILAIFEAMAFVATGAISPNLGLGIDPRVLTALLVIQIAMGGWLIIFMDEIVSKWGIGSGVGLFIVAGVAKTILIGLISPLVFTAPGEPPKFFFEENLLPVGRLLQIITGKDLQLAPFVVLSTIAIFLIVAFAMAMRVEIPLTFGNIRGFGRKWPLRFLYTSNLPVILTAALIQNLLLFAGVLSSRGIDLNIFGYRLIGNYQPGLQAEPYTLPFFLSNPFDFAQKLITGSLLPADIWHAAIYTLIFVLASMMFSVFWVRTAGMDAENVANQIHSIGMRIPGFRHDKRILVKVLDRYIPALAVLGGGFVGFLAAFADLTSAIGTGTGLLLSVTIIFQLYEEISRQHLEDMHPILRRFVER